MKNGAMYAQCMSKSGPDFNKTADLAADYSDGTYCDKQERTHADRHCYPVADAHIVASDPDSTFDKQTAWETLYHLAGGVNGNRCGYLTYRDLAVVHNCHPEAFGCAETATAGDPYVNFKAADLSAAGTPVGKKVMAGTGANTGKAAKTYTTCIRRSEISCGDGSGAAPAGWSWADLLPKPFTGDMRDTPFTVSPPFRQHPLALPCLGLNLSTDPISGSTYHITYTFRILYPEVLVSRVFLAENQGAEGTHCISTVIWAGAVLSDANRLPRLVGGGTVRR